MRARARLVVERDRRGRSVVRELRSDAPIVLRRTCDAVYLVGGAAGPLGGDRLVLDVHVGPGARLVIRSVAASIARPGSTGEYSRFEVHAEVGAGGSLHWQPEPLIAAAACRHEAISTVDAAPDACVRWREELVIGRLGERPGALSARLTVRCAGAARLRQELRVGDDRAGWDGPAVLGGARATGTLVALGGHAPVAPAGGWPARTRVLALEGGGIVVTSVGAPDAVRRSLDAATA